jgi:CMP-N,N'-diacetyllegionaminic acid synthase
MEKNKNLAIIPARSGSKGLKDKNIKDLNGMPLLAYSIDSAKKSGLFDEIYVSTDSEEYAEIAKSYGASVPFLRSKETATDAASSWDVVREAIKRYNDINQEFNLICLLQPTTPLRTANDILNAFQLLESKNANAIVSVCEVDHSPLWCNVLPEDLSLSNFIKKDISKTPRQRLDRFYRLNGAIYLFRVDYFKICESIYDSKCYASIMDKEKSIDIDDNIDFIFAETVMKSNHIKND